MENFNLFNWTSNITVPGVHGLQLFSGTAQVNLILYLGLPQFADIYM